MKLASARGTRSRISRATNGFRMQLMMMGLYTPSPGTPVRNAEVRLPPPGKSNRQSGHVVSTPGTDHSPGGAACLRFPHLRR